MRATIMKIGLAWALLSIAACSPETDHQGTSADTKLSEPAKTVPASAGGAAGAVSAAIGPSAAQVNTTPERPASSSALPPPPPMAAGGALPPATAPSTPAAAPGGETNMPPAATQPQPMNPPEPSAGCNKADFPAAGGMMTVDVDGTPREYVITLPTTYDPAKPYRLVFGWHGLGGNAMQVAAGFSGGYYGLATPQRWANEAVFMAGQGLESPGPMGSAGGAGWSNMGGRDVAFVKKLVDWATTNYCIDKSRIFSTGMSYGGIMSNTLGCQMGDVFRAIAPMAGSGPAAFGGAQCVGQAAAWMSHGRMDTVVPFASGQASRDHWVKTNHCMTESMPVAPEGCVSYNGCDAGHPVHWCEFDGGHTVPPYATEAIFNFFSQF